MEAFTDICLLLGVTGGLLLLLEAGRRIGRERYRSSGLATIDGAVFGLMGLLIAFTFSGAAARFDEHRHLIVKEANAIGTAYLRVDLLPEKEQPVVRDDFRRYVDARLAFYRNINSDMAGQDYARATALQSKVWRDCVSALSGSDNAARSLTFSALNEMIDITTTRAVALETHPPAAIYVTLAVLIIGATLLAGYEMGTVPRRNWTYMLAYSVIIALAICLIVDLEFPRSGLIRVDAADHVLVDLRQKM